VFTVLQSPEQAYFYTYLDESYLCGHINGSLSESEVDAVLDSVCWSNIGKKAAFPGRRRSLRRRLFLFDENARWDYNE
jgi:hypothetical protein